MPDKYDAIAARLPELTERMGADPVSLSPYHHVGPGAPPAVIFHGRADTTVPYRSVEIFTEKMQADGNRCELHGYEGKTHGFFNYGRDDGLAFYDTVRKMDAFLVSLGWLTGQPTIRAPSE